MVRALEFGVALGVGSRSLPRGLPLKMADENKLVPRENGSNDAIELVPAQSRLPAFELSPARTPPLRLPADLTQAPVADILSFMLAVVTIVAIATFRMQPVYVATARVEIDRENAKYPSFSGRGFLRLHDGSLKLHRGRNPDPHQ